MKTVFAILLALAAIPATAADNDLSAHIVLFHAVDQKPPVEHAARLASLGEYTEAFLAKEMRRWKKSIERTKIFARDAKGKIRVTVVSGKLASTGRDALPQINIRAMREAGKQLRIPSGRPVVWWVFYDYPDVKGFRGGARGMGGMAINAYPAGEGALDLTQDLASPEFATAAIKGMVHEFGHALGLPHIGPRPGRKLGNSLMGPVNRAYWGKTGSDEQRVYLSEVSAAMLWKHPIFQVSKSEEPEPVKIETENLKAHEVDGQIVIEGIVSAENKAHTAVVLDSERGRFGDYWARPYVGKIDPQSGEFRVVIEEPYNRGMLHLSFSLVNGSTTDGTKPFQRGSDLRFSYQGKSGSRKISRPANAR